MSPEPLNVPGGYYRDVAWLQDNTLALEYLDTLATKNWDTRLMIYNTALQDAYWLPDEVPAECHETRYGRFSRLPDGRLGYQYECIPHKGGGRDFRLHAFDVATQSDQELYRYPIPFESTAFAFAPSMESWLQEEQGDGLYNKLYWVTNGHPPLRLLEASFARAGWPQWLPDGRLLFAGSAKLPEGRTNIFSGLPSLARQMDAPWNIYHTDLRTLQADDPSEMQIVLAGVVGIRGPRASADGKRIAFLGAYDGLTGLWVYDMTDQQLVRIWNGFGPFDWSPDGRKLVVLVRDPAAEVFAGQPTIIDVPEFLSRAP